MASTPGQPPLLDLGYANGWGDNEPEQARLCREQKHRKECELLNTRGTLHRYTCPVCAITYLVDSSD